MEEKYEELEKLMMAATKYANEHDMSFFCVGGSIDHDKQLFAGTGNGRDVAVMVGMGLTSLIKKVGATAEDAADLAVSFSHIIGRIMTESIDGLEKEASPTPAPAADEQVPEGSFYIDDEKKQIH